MELTEEWLEAVFKKHSRENTVAKVLNVESEPAVAVGENYVGTMTRIKIEVILGSGRKTKKSILVKEMPQTELRKAQFTQMGFFLREIMMYRDIIPYMEKIMDDASDPSDHLWGKCIDYTPYEKLILEDLSDKGFKMADRFAGLDLDHAKLVMRSLAKFHAISISLIEKQMIPMDVFGRGVFEGKPEITKEFHEKAFEGFIEFSENTWGEEWKPIFAKMNKKFGGKTADLYLEKIKRNEDKFNVLNHGDCWLNNMLFKYDEFSDKPTSLKFIDFQLSSYNSPAQDLQYFMNTTPSLEVRMNNREDLLKTYHEALVKSMKILECNREPIKYEQLLQDYQDLDFFGLITAVTILPIVLMDKKDKVLDLEKTMKDQIEGKTSMKTILPFDNPNFIKIMKFILKDCESRDLF